MTNRFINYSPHRTEETLNSLNWLLLLMVNVREGTLKFLSHQNVRFRLPIFVDKVKARLRVPEQIQFNSYRLR